MAIRPFRFIHAADFHLEQPTCPAGELPEGLAALAVDAPYQAAQRVFDAVLAEEADFLVLCGNLLSPLGTGPHGPLFLVRQFQRLAERGVAVYWALGPVEAAEAWPPAIELPENVRIFAAGRVSDFIHQRDGLPLVRILGASRLPGRTIRAGDFDPDPGGLFTIAAVHGTAEPETLRARGIDYWALGGNPQRDTLFSSPQAAHYPGSPQARSFDQPGAHGCTLVQVDHQRQSRPVLLATDVLRFCQERIVVGESADRAELETLLRQRAQALRTAAPGVALAVHWTVAAAGPLAAALRRGRMADELLKALRDEFAGGPAPLWSLALEAEAPAAWPPALYDQQTLLGDFLREVRRLQTDAAAPLQLGPAPGAAIAQSDGALADPARRQSVLREAAALGIDLLSPEDA